MGCACQQPVQKQEKLQAKVQLHQQQQLRIDDFIYSKGEYFHGYGTDKFNDKNKKQRGRRKKYPQTQNETPKEVIEKEKQEKSRVRFVINQYDANPYEMSPVPQEAEPFHQETKHLPKVSINKENLFPLGDEQQILPQAQPSKEMKSERLMQAQHSLNRGKENCMKFKCICQRCIQNHLSRFLDNTYEKDICECRGYGVKLERARASRRCQKCLQQTRASLQICSRCYGNGFIAG